MTESGTNILQMWESGLPLQMAEMIFQTYKALYLRIRGSVSIPLLIFQHQGNRQGKRHQLRCGRRQPDSVYSQKQGQRQHGDQHKYEGSGKRKDSRDHSVGQRSEHSAGKNVEPDKEQRDGTYSVSRHRQSVHRVVRAGKYRHQRFCQQKGSRDRNRGDNGDYLHAQRDQLPEFVMILLPVIKTEHGCHPIRISRIEGAGKHEHIHDDCDSRHSIFSYIAEHCPVKHHGDDSGDQGGGHLRASVCGGVGQDAEPEYRLFEMQEALPAAEHNQPHHRRNGIPEPRGHRGPADPQIETGDKHIVKRHVQNIQETASPFHWRSCRA